MSNYFKFLLINCIALTALLYASCKNSSRQNQVVIEDSTNEDPVDGKPHFVLSVYDASLTDSPVLKVDAIYRIIKDTMIINKKHNPPTVDAYRDTSYFVPMVFVAFDSTGKKHLKTQAGIDSFYKKYVNVSPQKILKDGGMIDSIVAHYAENKQKKKKT